jgi:type II secretory pathway component PulL
MPVAQEQQMNLLIAHVVVVGEQVQLAQMVQQATQVQPVAQEFHLTLLEQASRAQAVAAVVR